MDYSLERCWILCTIEFLEESMRSQKRRSGVSENTERERKEGLWLSELKAERERAGLTQRELVEASGVSRGTLVKLETGRRPTQSRTAKKLAEALGVSIRRLAGEEELLGGVLGFRGEGVPEPGAPRTLRKAMEDDYLRVYVGDRSEEEVVAEARQWYRLMQAARANAEAGAFGEDTDLGEDTEEKVD